MATIAAGRYGIAKDTGGHIEYLTEANSQTYKAGQLVYLNGGAVTACASDATDILGIVLADGSNVTTGNPLVPVWIPGPDDEIYLQVVDGTSSSAGASTDLGVDYAIAVSSNVCYVDRGDTTNVAVTVVGKHPSDAWTDTSCRYRCIIKPTVAQRRSGT